MTTANRTASASRTVAKGNKAPKARKIEPKAPKAKGETLPFAGLTIDLTASGHVSKGSQEEAIRARVLRDIIDAGVTAIVNAEAREARKLAPDWDKAEARKRAERAARLSLAPIVEAVDKAFAPVEAAALQSRDQIKGREGYSLASIFRPKTALGYILGR